MSRFWRGCLGWLHRNFFATPINILISLVLLSAISFLVYEVVDWAVFRANWSAANKEGCGEGACWAFIRAKFWFFLFGFYPGQWLWRAVLTLVLLLLGVYWMLHSIRGRHLVWVFFAVCLILPLVIFVVLQGWGRFRVAPDRWGGLLMTVILSLMGLLFSFPLGIVLALLRTGKMRILRILSVVFIEFFRGIPLITILFMCSVVLPLFLPGQLYLPKLFRLVIGLTVFQAAYLAEVVRGGLQAIDKGQYEAAYSLGMEGWRANYFVILPQALRLSLANITGIMIAFVKDTSLVLIVGWFDLLGIVKPLSSDVYWLGMEPEGYLFVGLIFWFLCAAVSRIGKRLEHRLNRYMIARH